MENDNENSKNDILENDEQIQDMDSEDIYNLDDETSYEESDEESEINPDYIFREDDQTFLLNNGTYQVLTDEVLDDIQRLRNEKRQD